MIPVRKLSIALLVTFALAGGTALASWYDDYDAGIAAPHLTHFAPAAKDRLYVASASST